jgi:SAM-dependent methyltransferase
MGDAIGTTASAAYDVVGRYRQDEINGFGPGLVERMLDAARLRGAETVLDAMAGDGNLTERLHAYCRERGMAFPRTTVLEFSKVQAEFARHAVAPLGASVLWGDALAMQDLATGRSLEESSFDRVLIKSATHEIPRDRQPDLYRSIFRVLRPGGIFTNLGFVFDDPAERDEVRELARVKDRLAGMEGAVRNRYFLMRDEFTALLKEAGFIHIRAEESFRYQIRSQVVAEQYYAADRRLSADLDNQAAQVRCVVLRRNGRIRFEGVTSLLLFPGEITTARKPTPAETSLAGLRQHPMDLLRKTKAHSGMLEEAARCIEDGDTVLDLGCGIGLLAEVLPEGRNFYRGLDLSAEHVAIARERHADRPGISFEVGNVATRDLGSACADVITILQTLHHPGIDAVRLLRGAYAALKPGGRLVVAGPCSPQSLAQIGPLLLEQLRREGALEGNEALAEALGRSTPPGPEAGGYYCSAEGMEALLKHLGFSRTMAARHDFYQGLAYFVVARK